MPMDDKTKEEVREKLQEVRVLVEEMHASNKRQTRVTMILYGVVLEGLAWYARMSSLSWMAITTDPKIQDTLGGVANISVIMMVLAAVLVAFGVIGEDQLERWLEKLLGKPHASEGDNELSK